MAVFNTYIDEMRCPDCKNIGTFELQSEAGDSIFLRIRPNDFVSEWKEETHIIDGYVDCAVCGISIRVKVPVFYGVVGRMYPGDLPDNIWKAETVIDRLKMALECNVQEKRRHRHAFDVLDALIRFWKNGHGDWKMEEEGLPPVGRATSAEQLIDAIKVFIDYHLGDIDDR